MRRKIGKLLFEIGIVLLLLALSLFLYNCYEASKAQTASELVVAEITQEIENNPLLIYQEEETTEVDGYSYIGVLDILRFGLELPVQEEWSYPGLKIAPGRYSGSVETNDLVICGHNYERHFGKLKNLVAGDDVTFTTIDGTVYEYEVTEVFTIEPTAIDTLLSGDWDLCLYTCTYGGQTRVVVRCKLVEE